MQLRLPLTVNSMLLRKGLLCAALLLVLCGHGGAAARPVVEARALRSRQLMAGN